MKTKFSKNSKYIVSNCSKEKMKKFSLSIFSFLILMVLSMPIMSYAAWTDSGITAIKNKVNNVSDKVGEIKNDVNEVKDDVKAVPENIKTQLKTLPYTIQDQLDITIDEEVLTNVRNTITEITEVITDLNEQRRNFDDAECATFKSSLKLMFSNLEELTGSISTIGLPNPPAYTPSVDDAIDDIPCKVLVVPSLAFKNTPVSEIETKLSEINDHLQVLLPLFITEIEDILSENSTNEIIYSDFCKQKVIKNRDRITYAAMTMKSLSVFIQLVAAAVDTETFTGGGDIAKLRPKANEADVGIHGYAHITMKRADSRHKIAAGLRVSTKILDGIQSTASAIKNRCINTHNQYLIYTQQEEIRQLLLTPHGLRK